MLDSLFISRTDAFRREVSKLEFTFDGVVYNPLDYAWDMFLRYEDLALSGDNGVMFMGMNPGPDGMMQTGVPFGARSIVKDYLGLSGTVSQPAHLHPARPVTGLEGRKDEPSGMAFWSMIRSIYPDCHDFFSFATVQNFCPLAFVTGDRGRNVTPDKLPRQERRALEEVCLDYLAFLVAHLHVRTAVAVGNYAYDQLMKVGCGRVLKILHPSPINPAAHRVWADDGRQVAEYLVSEGVLDHC